MDGSEIRHPRILVADEDDTVREVTREMLRGFGMEADSVRTSGELMDRYRRSLIRSRRYDLVILGVYRPFELGGEAEATRLLELDPDARVIISTALVGGASFPVRGPLESVHFLARPYRMQDLLRAVQDALSHPKG
ncbi:MAG: hypothetical protein SA339_12685 [Methanomassiliicoccus sp.]|nr:hypothetical protein [Methanomassiliicoccus sp.]